MRSTGTLRTRIAGSIAAAVIVAGLCAGPAAAGTAPVVEQVSAGALHTCALTDTGSVKCWGANRNGQLGDGSTTDRTNPVQVRTLHSAVAAVVAGQRHTCALTDTGAVKCWGSNNRGQLGDDTKTDRRHPVQVKRLRSGITAVTAGRFHTCALTDEGSVKCWGDNSGGQLGDGTTMDHRTPARVRGLGSDIEAISAGAFYTCAVTGSGAAKCWGFNSSGQLGDGTTTTRLKPVAVKRLSSGVEVISAGGFHTCALTTGGAVKCWGANDDGQVGDGTGTPRLRPVQVVGLGSGVAAISAGVVHTCALTDADSVTCWGLPYGNEPVDVAGLSSDVAAVSSGLYHSCAVTDAGGVKCWGENRRGALGDGSTTDSWTPVDVVWL